MSGVQKINDELFIDFNEAIGSGAYGMVYKGTYKNEVCAVKMLHHVATPMKANFPVGPGQQNAICAFGRESIVLESFEHPNVLQHLATTEHSSGNIMLVTELMDCNLSTYLSTHDHSSSLTSQCEISLSKDLASGLAYIHSRKIIHRDLCGVNVLLKQSQPFPIAKISDFGMSKLLDPLKFNTTIGHRMGYLPREALHEEKEDYDQSLDVFSCGVIMIQIALRLENVNSGRERSSYFEEIKAGLHPLKPHVMACLQEDKKRRPSATFVRGQLEKHLMHGDTYVMDYDYYATLGEERPSFSMLSLSGSPANRVTLQELTRRYNLTDEQLNREIEDSDTPKLALYFDNVSIYSSAMGLAHAEQADVNLYHREGTQIAMMRCLRVWKQRDPLRATYRALLDIVLGLGKGDTAHQICQQLSYTGLMK
ncbi:probable serine/threonine-protein kinase kinY isoform X1 [Halichondria panicea]|uniref:probable serine/threonine-protein kinase kinY isoform X1 n=1 Tax=Halichondria panicea TaxID=6063 RepID=UPI00312BB665